MCSGSWGLSGDDKNQKDKMMQISPITAAARVSFSTVIAPLADCLIAPENVRQEPVSPDFIAELSESIASSVGLLNSLNGYKIGANYYITAGGQRLFALKKLADEGRLPEAFAEGVPVEICDQDEAVEISIAENAARSEMSLADELRGFRVLAQKGMDPLTIARKTSNSEKHVAKMLRLGSASPKVLALLDEGKIDLDALKAFATVACHERQDELVDAGLYIAHQIKSALTNSMVAAKDHRVRYVGHDAYIAAGGAVETDLLNSNIYYVDEALLNQLFSAKKDAAFADLTEAGWANVVEADPNMSFYSPLKGYERAPTETRSFTDEEQAQYDEAVAGEAGAPDWTEGNSFRQIQRSLERGLIYYSEDVMAEATMFARIGYDGLEQFPLVAIAAQATAKEVKLSTAPFGHAGHETMTRVASLATRNALALDVEAGFDVAVAHTTYTVMRGKTAYNSSQVISHSKAANIEDAEINLTTDKSFLARFDKWDEVLPEGFAEILDFVGTLSINDKMELMALVTALQVDAIDKRADQINKERWKQMAMMVQRAKIDFSKVWTPAEAFLSNGNKASLTQVLKDCEITDDMGGLKKAALVETVAKAVKNSKWVPGLLQSLTVKSKA